MEQRSALRAARRVKIDAALDQVSQLACRLELVERGWNVRVIVDRFIDKASQHEHAKSKDISRVRGGGLMLGWCVGTGEELSCCMRVDGQRGLDLANPEVSK